MPHLRGVDAGNTHANVSSREDIDGPFGFKIRRLQPPKTEGSGMPVDCPGDFEARRAGTEREEHEYSEVSYGFCLVRELRIESWNSGSEDQVVHRQKRRRPRPRRLEARTRTSRASNLGSGKAELRGRKQRQIRERYAPLGATCHCPWTRESHILCRAQRRPVAAALDSRSIEADESISSIRPA
jgi:hypothetical protein